MERVLQQEEVYVAVDMDNEAGEPVESTAGFPAVGFLHPLNQSWLSRSWSLLVRLRLAALDYLRPDNDADEGNIKVRFIQDDSLQQYRADFLTRELK